MEAKLVKSDTRLEGRRSRVKSGRKRAGGWGGCTAGGWVRGCLYLVLSFLLSRVQLRNMIIALLIVIVVDVTIVVVSVYLMVVGAVGDIDY